MNKRLIICDSSASFTSEEASHYGIPILPLSVIVEKDVYRDQVEIDSKAVYAYMNEGKQVSTSQPSVGEVMDVLRQYQGQYEEILVLTLPQGISGTFSNVTMAAKQLGFDNVHVVDGCTSVGVLQTMAIKAKEWSDQGMDLQDIISRIMHISKNSITLIYPKTLDQLKKGGRITPAAAMMASLLKIKPVLKLVNGGQTIDKYKIAKSEKKVNDIFIEEIDELKIVDKELQIHIMHADHMDKVEELRKIFMDAYPNCAIKITLLSPVLAAHTGVGCVVVQACMK